jgi:hypothetical protein
MRMILADMDCNGFVTPSARRRKVNVFVFHAGLTFFLGNYAKISRIAKNELFMSFSPQQR